MAAAALRHDVYRRADWARRVAHGAKVAEPEAVPDSPEDRHLTAISAFIVGLRTAPAFSTLAYLLGLAWRVLRRELATVRFPGIFGHVELTLPFQAAKRQSTMRAIR